MDMVPVVLVLVISPGPAARCTKDSRDGLDDDDGDTD
jgi:hypothetical protein